MKAVWIAEAALLGVAVLRKDVRILRVLAVLSVVLLIRTPLVSLYNLAAIAGIVLLLVRSSDARARVLQFFGSPLVWSLIGLLFVFLISTLLAAPELPRSVLVDGIRSIAGLAAAGSLALFVFLDSEADSWVVTLSVAIAAAAGLRLASSFGWDAYPWIREHLDAYPAGQVLDYGSRNTLGSILVAAVPVLLFRGDEGSGGRAPARALLPLAAAGLSVVALVSVQSRTGNAVFLFEMGVCFLLALWRGKRQIGRPLGALAVFFLAPYVLPATGERPVVTTERRAPPVESLGSLQQEIRVSSGPVRKRPIEKGELAQATFRIPLFAPSQSVRHSFMAADSETAVWVHGRATPNCRGTLRVLLDGRSWFIFRGRGLFPPNSGWFRLVFPAPLVAGRWYEITFIAEGDLSPVDSYYELSGLAYASPGARTEFRRGEDVMEEDLSADPGIQRGIALVLPGDSRALPAGRWLHLESGRGVLDTSTRDRLALWSVAIEHWRERPVWGWGFYTFGYFFPRLSRGHNFFDSYANAHNQYLEILHDAGAVGILGLLAIFAAAAWSVGRLLRRGTTIGNWALVLALGGFAATSVTQVTLSDQRYYGLIWLLTGMFLREIPRDPSLAANSRVEHGQSR
jgi:hypothetical protein